MAGNDVVYLDLSDLKAAANSEKPLFSRVYYFGCFKVLSKSVQVLFNGIDAVLVLTLIFLKEGALFLPSTTIHQKTIAIPLVSL